MSIDEIEQKIVEIDELLGKATNSQQYAALLQAQALFVVARQLYDIQNRA